MRRSLMLIAALCLSCASAEAPDPSKQQPRSACAISCPAGWMFRPQHLCRSGQRWFQDVLLIGRNTTRGADGAVISDTWITAQGDFAVADVEMGACSSVIARIVAGRDASQRGQHPGEDAQGNPSPPNK